jgi:hypothetical protein
MIAVAVLQLDEDARTMTDFRIDVTVRIGGRLTLDPRFSRYCATVKKSAG